MAVAPVPVAMGAARPMRHQERAAVGGNDANNQPADVANNENTDGNRVADQDDDDTTTTQHAVLEMSYVGSTRAVITHGFHVRELLFGGEFASLRVANWLGRDAQSLCAMVEYFSLHQLGLLDDYVVESMDGVPPQVVTLHLVNKHVAARLFQGLTKYRKDLIVQPVCSSVFANPEEITRDGFGGRIRVAWADGVSKGAALLYFCSATSANAFLTSCYLKTNTAFALWKVEPVGLEPLADDRYTEETTQLIRRMRELDLEQQPWLAPLTELLWEDRHWTMSRLIFDEAAIQAMPADQGAQLQYRVRICSGLSKNVDETELAEMLRPHRVVRCPVKRSYGNEKFYRHHAKQQRRERCIAPLVELLNETEVCVDWKDKNTNRAGVFVQFPSLQRLHKVFEKVTNAKTGLWEYKMAEKPHAQPVRMYIEYTFRVSLAPQVYECFRDKFMRLKTNGVRYAEAESSAVVKKRVDLRFRSRNLDALKAVERIIQYEKLPSDVATVLLTQAGRMKVQTWSDDQDPAQICVRIVEKDKSIWIYGDETVRANAVSALRELAGTIQTGVEVLDRIVRVNVAKIQADVSSSSPAFKSSSDGAAIVKHWLASQYVAERLFHYGVLGKGSRVVVSGSTALVDYVLQSWATNGFIMERGIPVEGESSGQQQQQPDCGVCMMPADEPVTKFALCGHTFCLECIQPGVNASSPLPLRCPVENCNSFIHVHDVSKITQDVDALVDNAVFDYVARHPSECIVCPKAGCNQILARVTIEEQRFIHCECCAQSYCLDCSEATGQALERHDDLSCQDFQEVCGAGADIHVRFIRERIFTLCCPHCKVAFLDFDGCTSVHCGNVTCRVYFCANCLEFSAKSSDTTHKHVLTCAKNPNPGNYFVSDVRLAMWYRDLRESQLREYLLTNIPSCDARRVVLKRLSKDLSDLGISIASVFAVAPVPVAAPLAAPPVVERR